MYLKRLDTQGFKSFANKTALEFGAGVTCIVGPNGTGKTNVADALRWVLGEHVSRAIRARKTEDVIFAGSDRRAPLGFAEVSITLDNGTGWLPIEFTDVVVARRAYRSGENEYFINSARVRLRDVVELFMRAQVGQNSYAFMGQGMVEQALSLRPEDRRALIEEAADVRIYRTKLEDARTKLKATRENVERARLLVREIEPRITQLERQAGRAARYRDLTRELAATLHIWYEQQWHDVNDQLLAAVTSHDQRTEQLSHARAEAKACEDGLAQLRAAIDERRGEIDVRAARLRALEDYMRDLERRVDLDHERGTMLAERIRELSDETASLQHERDGLPDLSADGAGAADLQHAHRTLDEQRSRLAQLERDILELHRSALTSEQAAARARALADELARNAAAAAGDAERLRRDGDAALAERQHVHADIDAHMERARDRQGAASLAREELTRARERRDLLVELWERARQERDQTSDELRASDARAEALRVRAQLIEQIDVRPSAPDAGIRAILEAGGVLKRVTVPEDVELQGVRGLLYRLVRVPSGLENAIQAALGENMHAVVFEREADMRAAVAMLLGGDSGRATMYALDHIHESRPLNLIKERGVVGVASALVKCESRYRKLVDTLLGRTVVVDSLALAERYIRRGLAHAVATLDGVLLRPVGSFAAGTPASAEAALAYARETGDAPQEIQDLEAVIRKQSAALQSAQSRLSEAERRLADHDRLLDESRERSAQAESEASAAAALLDALNARLPGDDGNAQHREDEIVRRASQAKRLAAERDEHLREALACDERMEAARRSMLELEGSREQLAEAIANQAVTVALLQGESRSGGQLIDRGARQRLDRQITAKADQRTRFQQEAHNVGARLAATRRDRESTSGDADALRGELEPARRELAQFESRERSLSTELVEANARVRDAERLLMEAENEARLRREELDSLRVTLESEGFVATAEGEVIRSPDRETAPAAARQFAAPGDLPGWLRTEDGERGLPPIRGGSSVDAAEVRDRVAGLRAQIRALGPVNEQAAGDYEETRERYEFLTAQLTDLRQTEQQLDEAIDELESVIRDRFRTTFRVVNKEFERYFSAFFRGGTARLELGETDDDGLPGVDIYAQPPGKKLGSLALLSGGERSLTAVALLFALLSANPSPICVLDEVDAALDEANVGRFVDELSRLAEKTQFVIITHNRRTIEMADTIYGVSMGADNVSRVLGLKLSDIPRDGAD